MLNEKIESLVQEIKDREVEIAVYQDRIITMTKDIKTFEKVLKTLGDIACMKITENIIYQHTEVLIEGMKQQIEANKTDMLTHKEQIANIYKKLKELNKLAKRIEELTKLEDEI